MKAKIFEIKRFAIHDGDGIRTTVFLKGCPLRCVWCHNPEGISPDTQEAFFAHKCIDCGECKREGFTAENCLGEARVAYGKEYTVSELMPILLEDVDFYASSGGGVTLSGGECLMQADFCAELLKALKEQGIHTAVDTCGFVSRKAFEKVINYTDTFLYDLKAFDEDVHIKCTERSNRVILKNLEYLDSMGKNVEIRIPYVPEYNDDQIEKIARFLAPFKSVSRIRVLPYHNYAGSKYDALHMKNTLPKRLPTAEELERVKGVLRKNTNFEIV